MSLRFGLATLVAILASTSAHALPSRDNHEDLLNDAATLSEEALQSQRGGFVWGGMAIRLGADIRTYINGELALQTIVNWSGDGASRSDIISGALSPAGADVLRAGVLSTGSITMNVGNNSVFLANGGQTALLHRTDGGIQNILVNTASNATLRQEADISLDIANFAPFSRDAFAFRLGTSAGEEIARLTAVGF